jgi:hypothetical protein
VSKWKEFEALPQIVIYSCLLPFLFSVQEPLYTLALLNKFKKEDWSSYLMLHLSVNSYPYHRIQSAFVFAMDGRWPTFSPLRSNVSPLPLLCLFLMLVCLIKVGSARVQWASAQSTKTSESG